MMSGRRVLHADDPKERHAFTLALSMKLGARVYAPQEVVISSGDRMEGTYLVRSGIAFGGAKGFGRAYTVGKWFAIEALLLERRFNFDVR